MALGLNKRAATSIFQNNGITLRSLMDDAEGFPMNYIPKMRKVNGEVYIRTCASGHDNDMAPVFFKWLIIDPKDLSATPDSTAEYAKLPANGFIMRIKQRSALPYHENFTIDYYEDINALSVITVDKDARDEFLNKMEGIYRTFRIGDSAVPEELKTEIYTYPEIFFNTYIRDAIPGALFYNGKMYESNQMSAYASTGKIDMNIMSHGLNQNVGRPSHNITAQPYRRITDKVQPSRQPVRQPVLSRNSSVASKQQMINQQIKSQTMQNGGSYKSPIHKPNSQPSAQSFYDAGFRYMQ